MKRQVVGNERTIIKEDASIEDLRAEMLRLQDKFGYDIEVDEKLRIGRASHKFYRGKFVLSLEPDE